MVKGVTIHFYCLFDGSHFSNICTLSTWWWNVIYVMIMYCNDNSSDCVNIWKRSEAVPSGHSCTELCKMQFFPVSLVNIFISFCILSFTRSRGINASQLISNSRNNILKKYTPRGRLSQLTMNQNIQRKIVQDC